MINTLLLVLIICCACYFIELGYTNMVLTLKKFHTVSERQMILYMYSCMGYVTKCVSWVKNFVTWNKI